jgi:CPA2 family monovalent cation:H+ antiporter-2
MDILSLIVITLTIAIALNLVLKRFHISPIVGYIITGACIALSFNLAHIDKHILAEVAEFGIVFLMFTIGLEFSVSHLKSMKKEVFVFGFLQTTLTALFFMAVCYYLFGIDFQSSLVVGLAIALSSTAIVLKTLNENGDIHKPYGRNALGILLFQDIAVIPILILITFLSDQSASLGDLMINTLVSGVIVLTTIFFVGKYVAAKLIDFVADTKSNEMFISAILLIVLASALFAHYFGFSYSLGAFFAGMIIAETRYKYQVEADLVPFRDLLLGLFFITVGMQIDYHIVMEYFVEILLITFGIMIFKSAVIFGILRFFTTSKSAFKTSFTLFQVGEFSFAVFALAKSNNLVDSDILQIMLSVVVITLVLTSLFIRYTKELAEIAIPLADEAPYCELERATIKDHVVVCGYSSLGQSVVKELKSIGIPHLAIEHDRKNLMKKRYDNNDIVYFGNAASRAMLESIDIESAKALIIAINNPKSIRMICEVVNNIKNDIYIVVNISDESEKETLQDLKIDEFVYGKKSIASLLVHKVLDNGEVYST